MSKGTFKNPLADEPEKPQSARRAKPGGFLDEFDIPVSRQLRTVSFSGRTMNINVEAGGDAATDEAKASLGAALAAYFKIHPELFASQNVSLKRPLDPCVTFVLGGTTLYATAGSTVADTARLMAVDRLAIIFTAAKASPVGRALLDRHKINVSRRG